MTYEKEIPEYALQPAKAPQFVQAEGIYHTEKLHYPAEKKTTVFQLEEDILVPDTKADMRDILLMDASCDVAPEEKKLLPKSDESVHLSGMITLQTLYQPEDPAQGVIGITSKLSYKYMWNLHPDVFGEGVFSCRVKSLEYMVINERKFRVKLALEFSVQMFRQQELQFFNGLKEETLEMKKEEVPLVCLSLVKKDQVSIDETFSLRETDHMPEKLLKQTFSITENYRQVTTEKVVINGFVFVHLLYLSAGSENQEGTVREINQRIEFTQFIPIDKDQRTKKWSAVKILFIPRSFNVVQETEGEEGGACVFRVRGDIDTRVELYEMKMQEMVVDAYHREKSFHCGFKEAFFRNLSSSFTSEYGLRDVISLKDGYKAEEAVCCESRITDCRCWYEKGNLLAGGSIEHTCLWKDGEGNYYTVKQVSEFQQVLDTDQTESYGAADCYPVIKNCFVSLINETQMELNVSILLCCEIYHEKRFFLMTDPGFSMEPREKEFPMIITALKTGESLWDLAKRYRTTETRIREINGFETDPEPGRKILVMK